MAGTLWLLLLCAGVALMWVMRWTANATLDAILIRAAASAFMGAGTVGAAGWIGDWLRIGVGMVNDIGQQAGAAALGTGAVWVIWLGLNGMWVLTMLPERVFKLEIPDWLAFCGLILPAVSGSIPGPIGEALRGVNDFAANLMIQLVGQLTAVR